MFAWWKKPPFAPSGPPWSVIVLLANVIGAAVLVQFEFLASAMTLTNMAGSLGVDPSKAFWFGKGFLLLMTLVIPPTIRLARRYGHKLLFVSGMGVSILGSLLSLWASTYWPMVAARCVAGAGAGMIFTLGVDIIVQNCPKRYQPITLLLFSNLAFGIGIGGGLLIGGYLGQSQHWQNLFWLTIIGYPLMLIVTCLVQPETKKKLDDPPFDFFGYFCSVIWVTAWLILVTEAKTEWNTAGWTSSLSLSMFFTGLIAFVAMLIHNHHHPNPLFSGRLFRDPAYSLATLGMVVVGLMVFGVILVSIGMLQHAFKYEQLRVGYLMSVIGFVYFVVGFLPGLLKRWLKMEWWILPGLGLVALSCYMSQFITVQSGQWQIIDIFVVRAAGIAMVIGPLTLLALSTIPEELEHKGSIIILYIRLIAATFGSSIVKTVVATRAPFHRLRFGEQVDVQGPVYQTHLAEVTRFMTERGVPMGEAQERARGQIVEQIMEQADLRSLIDAIYMLGWGVVGIMACIAILFLYRRFRSHPSYS